MNQRPEVSIADGSAIIDGTTTSIEGISLNRVVDSGAHGTVFEATETTLGRKIAVKVWYRSGLSVRDGAIGEVRKLASISHPLFVTVYRMDFAGATPYSIMEFLPGTSVKQWLRTSSVSRAGDTKLCDHLMANQASLRQRCKFWFLYSVGLRHLYERDLLHGDPHLGNVIVTDDPVGLSNAFLTQHVLRVTPLSSIKMLDLGTSLLRDSPDQIRSRESRVILETAERLFPDFNPRLVMEVNATLAPATMLNVLDAFSEYVLELSAVPGMTKTDFDYLSHGLPQLLGWCPFFNYEYVGSQLEALFMHEDANMLMSSTLDLMTSRYPLPDEQVVKPRDLPAREVISLLMQISRESRAPDWKPRKH